MCIIVTFKKNGGLQVGIDYKSIIPTVLTTAAILTAIGVIGAKCNNCKTYAQNAIVKPKAIEVFDSLHHPFAIKLCSINDSINVLGASLNRRIDILVEMIKIAYPNRPDIYKDAKNKVDNPGKFEGEY